jgi:phosphomannomutase
MIYDPSIFRAYDVRGTYPNQMNEKVAYAAGQAFVQVMDAKRVAVGRDVRATGPSLQQAMIQGVTDAGATAIDIGVISTEMLYFAAGTLDCDGGMSITASHNPAQWNGFKSVGKGGVPLLKEGKLGEIYDFIQSNRKLEQFEKGSVEQIDLLPLYTEYLKKYQPTDVPALKVVGNVNFGANGKVVDAATKDLPLTWVRLNWEEDGTFPKGAPDPMLSKNRQEISERIVAEGADFGAAWDADADRCFFYDEKGRFFHGYYITALLIKYFLQKSPGENVLAERRLVWASSDAIKEHGGHEFYTRPGHSYIKKDMREHNAIFAGEITGHYYYRDFFYCDNGIISFLAVLGIFAEQIKKGGKVSELLDYYMENYPCLIDDLNYTTDKGKEIMEMLTEKYSEGTADTREGLAIEFPNWRFMLRASATEPILRLNLEAKNRDELETRKTELMNFLEEQGAALRNDA